MREYLSVNQKSYDILAKEYEVRGEMPGKNESRPCESGRHILSTLENIQIKEKYVLEIGPGAGQTLQFFSECGYYTVGVELSGKMAQIAKKKSPKSLIICQDINSIRFFEQQFYVIYLGAVLHLFPEEDASELLENIQYWLNDDGILYVNTTINEKSSEGYFEKKDYPNSCTRYRKYWTESDFCSFVQRHGFNICDKGYSNEPEREKQWVALYCRKQMKG